MILYENSIELEVDNKEVRDDIIDFEKTKFLFAYTQCYSGNLSKISTIDNGDVVIFKTLATVKVELTKDNMATLTALENPITITGILKFTGKIDNEKFVAIQSADINEPKPNICSFNSINMEYYEKEIYIGNNNKDKIIESERQFLRKSLSIKYGKDDYRLFELPIDVEYPDKNSVIFKTYVDFEILELGKSQQSYKYFDKPKLIKQLIIFLD